jgi:L-amino acid N-acyltransferase YncA
MDLLYKIRPAAADDAEAIRAIRNHVIEHSTAMWTTTLLTPEDGETWLAENLARRSAFVAEAGGDVVGFANWAPWRPKGGYRFTVEDSVYLLASHQGRGVGAELLRTLIGGASESGAHVMMACIEATNKPSVALHARHGFELIGTAREVGTKFGRWLDLTMMSLALARARLGTAADWEPGAGQAKQRFVTPADLDFPLPGRYA